MIERYEIERAVEAFVYGPDLYLSDVKGEDLVTIDMISMRMNYLKHKYLRALADGKEDSEEIFERMCRIIPGFMLMED